MSLTERIKPYIDGLALIAPHKVQPGTIRSCDNGTMFLSEFVILQIKNGEKPDQGAYFQAIYNCLNEQGNLCRAPGDKGQDGPDNHYGVFAGCKALEIISIPQRILGSWFLNWGFSNNENPGTIYRHDWRSINWAAFLVRQPQLLAAGLSAAMLNRWYHFPLYLYTALVIATSCMGADIKDSDSRRLCWLLIETVKDDSLLCRLAAKLWLKRLHKHYGEYGMRQVAAYYYEKDHPFIEYWRDE